MMLTCFDIADYFLTINDQDAGDLISNLKLQKLVYYAQGFCLAFFNEPLFNEDIEAWLHGPVVPVLYDKYKQYRSSNIPIPQEIDIDKFSEEIKQLLNSVNAEYGQYSAWKLRDMTHTETPWINHYRKSEKGKIIPHKELKVFFETLIDHEED